MLNRREEALKKPHDGSRSAKVLGFVLLRYSRKPNLPAFCKSFRLLAFVQMASVWFPDAFAWAAADAETRGFFFGAMPPRSTQRPKGASH